MFGMTMNPTLSRVMANGAGAPILLLVMLAMMVLPLPALGLDLLFTFNIALGLVVLLAAIYAQRPLDFAVFPTVLLVATLLRLALNVASTRVVLINGHDGTDAAGHVIEAFGAFVIGGNYAVGLVVFSILVIINFVVVTKGAGRISEVSARFTLDAMPGKQMAIDADLNAGIVSQEEARDRRQEVAQEADFYGAMDGASKFVRGDAVAGILILVINLIGGLAIGMLQHDLAFSEAVRLYALLTIGDGLVAQIPSLVLSSAAAIMVTRVSSAADMGQQILGQLFDNPKALIVTAAVIGIMGLVPGMPNLVFGAFAVAAGGLGWYLSKRQAVPEPEESDEDQTDSAPEELGWQDVSPVDPLGLEVGYRLIPLVDQSQDGQLMARIKGVRRKSTQDLGFLMPAVHITDNLDLAPNAYRLTLLGVTVGEGEVFADKELAINPGEVYGEIGGRATIDPVFGLEAIWIDEQDRPQAQTNGYTVVDASTVIATHLSQVLQTHAHELLGHDEVQQLLDRLADSAPKLVEDLIPGVLPLGVLVSVLQNLLREGVPIRDLRTIVETLALHAPKSQEPDALTAAVRVGLGRYIVQHFNGLEGEMPVITLDPTLDQILHQTLQNNEESRVALEPNLAERIYKGLRESANQQEVAGEPALLLVADGLRPLLAKMARQAADQVRVLAFSEVPEHLQLRVVSTIGRTESLE